MRPRINAADIEQSDRWLEDPSEEYEGWPVCRKYNLRRGEIVAEYAPEDLEGWDISWPLEETPDLFLKFAMLHEEPDFEQAAFAFVHQYGLPDGTTIVSPFSGYERPLSDKMGLSRLLVESNRAWDGLALYEAVLNHDVDQAKALISHHEQSREDFGGYFRRHNREGATRTRFPPELVLALKAAVFRAKHVSDRLCTTRVDFTFDNATKVDSSCIRTYWEFENLIGVVYLQMYWLMTSGGGLTRCTNCGRLITLSHTAPGGRKQRSDRRFCDDTCRQAHHRSKKKL